MGLTARLIRGVCPSWIEWLMVFATAAGESGSMGTWGSALPGRRSRAWRLGYSHLR